MPEVTLQAIVRRIRPAALLPVAALCSLVGCTSLREAPAYTQPQAQPGPVGSMPPQPLPGVMQPGVPVPAPQRPLTKQFRLGPAASALVSQAHTQMNGGSFAMASATLERAMRIEPDNPLLWIELGQVRLGEGSASQADGMGRKALALATGDSQAQASAWRLIAESLRSLGRNQEAADAERRASSLALR